MTNLKNIILKMSEYCSKTQMKFEKDQKTIKKIIF